MAQAPPNADPMLKGENQLLYDLFLNAPASVAILTGPDLTFEFANPRYRKLLGVDRQIDGKPLLEVLPDVDPELLKIVKNVAFKGKRFVKNELPVLLDWDDNKKPYTKYFTLIYEPLLQKGSKANGFITFAFEITEQVEARQKVEESEEKYRSLFERMDQGFCILEMIFDDQNNPVDYRFLEINPTFEGQTGLKDAAGKTALELVPDLEKHWFQIYGKVALTGEPIRFVEGSDAMGRWFDVYSFRLGGENSRKVALLFTEITERRRSAENLKIKNEQLTKINNDLDNFIYTASHDLKAPVSNIEGLIGSLRDSLLSEYGSIKEDTEVILQMITQSIDRFQSTILDLTDITKAQKEEEDIQLVDCLEVLEDVKLSINDIIAESQAKIEVDTSQVNIIKFSKKNFKSIIYNLLSNAIKYKAADRRPEIRIETENLEEFVLLQVSDNGMGISKENLGKIFGMFKRVHDHVEGTGIGLYIVKRVIDNAGGKIEVESVPGQGTTFNVYFRQS